MKDGIPVPDFLNDLAVQRKPHLPELAPRQIEQAWSSAMPELNEFAEERIVTLVLNDATRFSPAPLLSPLERALGRKARILFATGTHRPVTKEEKAHLLGGCFKENEWANSHCDSGDMVYIGKTSAGTPVRIHQWILEGWPVVAVNSVEPHYFAGFTGGRKSFIPGVSSRETIVRNHALACLPGSRPGKLEGNPVHSDMLEALDMVESRARLVQGNAVVHGGVFVDMFAGSVRDSFRKAVRLSMELSSVEVENRAQLLILNPGEPLDVSLYQSQKAIYNCSELVQEGGWLLLVSACREGVGADHLEKAFRTSMDPRWRVPRPTDYSLGDHAIMRLRDLRSRAGIALASDLPRDLVAGMGIEPVDDAEKWIEEKNADSTLFVPEAAFTIPVLEGA